MVTYLLLKLCICTMPLRISARLKVPEVLERDTGIGCAPIDSVIQRSICTHSGGPFSTAEARDICQAQIQLDKSKHVTSSFTEKPEMTFLMLLLGSVLSRDKGREQSFHRLYGGSHSPYLWFQVNVG